ncbi:MAG: SusD/RagB family nutrient-binding outer membrane lipoprotein [Cyclobacteriaceae bacterium]|nr:SusD/RagB family nutrient-binding outer membrane lipoprotein [Cyclobacteriaceae bacterium]
MINNTSWVNNSRLTAPFINLLKGTNDPRISTYAMLPGSTSSYVNGDKTPANQKGYPMFGQAAEPRSTFSTSNKNTFGKYDAPYIHLSYAQVQFQLAELTVRGVISADAQSYYESGVVAAMKQLYVYGPEGEISEAQIENYLLENPYAPSNQEDALKLINTQYWIEAHFNWYELFANMRRSGYPDLYRTEASAAGYQLPKRLTYPSSEVSINPKLQDAVSRQGADVVTTAVWWDVD